MTVRSSGHTVLASADSQVYASVRRRPSSRAERYAMGRALRREVPRKSLGIWRAADTGARGTDDQLAIRVPARHGHCDGG